MALSSTEYSGDEVNCGSATALDNMSSFSLLFWIYPTSLGNFAGWCGKLDNTGDLGFWFHFNNSGYLDTGKHRTGTNTQAVSSSNIITINKWWFVAATLDTGGANGDQKLYVGDINTTVVEVSTYTTQQVGSGGLKNDSSVDVALCNLGTAMTSALGGRTGFGSIWDSYLTLEEIRLQQFNIWYPAVQHANCQLFMNLGFNGTGTQGDLSGKANNGVVSGLSVAGHVPLGTIRGGGGVWVVSAAPAGRTTKNTDTHPLGIHTGMSLRLPTHI